MRWGQNPIEDGADRVLLLPILHNRDSSQFVLDDNCLKAYIFSIIYIMQRKKQENVSPKTHVEDLTSPFSISFWIMYSFWVMLLKFGKYCLYRTHFMWTFW